MPILAIDLVVKDCEWRHGGFDIRQLSSCCFSNPMLAETFEDPRMKFVAEKVQHNPVEMAYHAEGKGWELTALSAGRTKFWGMISSSSSISLVYLLHRQKLGNHPHWHNACQDRFRSLCLDQTVIFHAQPCCRHEVH